MKNKEIVYNDIVFTYGFSRSSNPRYSMVLTMNIIDPLTNKRMVVKTKGQVPCMTDEPKTKEIKKHFYFKKDFVINEKNIETTAKKCAKELYAKYESVIIRKLRIKPDVGNINSNQMFIRYIDDFMRTQNKASSATQKEKKRILRNACEALADKPIAKLTNKDVENLFMGKKFAERKNLIKEFFEFCRNKNAFMGVNPIVNYLECNNLRKLRKTKKAYPKELSHIPLENEINLHNIMLEHINDYEIMAMILIKCAKLSLNEVLDLKWRDIEEFEGHYLVKGHKNNTGSFHTFDRPVLLEGSYLIKEKRLRLLDNVEEEKLQNRYVVPIRRGKRKNETQIKGRVTKYIRTMLIEAGLEPSEISSTAPDTRSPGGSGVILLHKHYEYLLRERCGLELDSPEGKYMRGLVPGDTTNLFYRSLSDRVSGIPYLLVIVRRDDFFLPRNYEAPEVKVEKRDEEYIYTIPSPGPGRRLSISIPKTYLQSGTQITIRSKYGVAGDITFKDYLSADDITEKKIY